MMKKQRIVVSPDEVAANIGNYARSVAEHPALAARIGKHPAWYAVRSGTGGWVFGPSKFVGYHSMSPEAYLSSYDRKDGRETEPVLARWFERVDMDTALGMELRDAFVSFASVFGRAPNGRWRISVLQEERAARAASSGADAAVSSRIAFDPNICGGRPRIAGTRVSVSDIVAALAAGETIAEILDDFPYLVEADIFAALNYAAKAVDHRILRAA